MADTEIATFEQIAVLLSQLMNNYNAIADNYYNIFYNTTPMDVTLELYNEEGNIVEYTIPNRAKDFRYIQNGDGSPENVVSAPIGTLYQDITNGTLYIKQIGTGRTGWTEINGNSIIETGDSSPQSRLTREKGTLFVDKSDATLYIKTTASGNTGWVSFKKN